MTRLGMLVRCDSGGLGNLTWEAWRHLHPEKTLVLDFDSGRGSCHHDRYEGEEIMRVVGPPLVGDVRAFLSDLDAVYTAETFYSFDFVKIARSMGVECFVHAMPEMHDPHECAGAHVLLPGPWESERFERAALLPVPIAVDRFADRARLRSEARVFYHPSSSAMMDRNGTDIVRDALPYVESEITVVIRGADRQRGRAPLPPNITLIEQPHVDGDYWDAYPNADVLLMPRRFGGLSLPINEAAALGMPVIATDLCPQCTYPHAMVIPATRPRLATMKGGPFHVWDAHPRDLAEAIDTLAGDPTRVRALSEEALRWAGEHSWSVWKPAYEATLRG